ncbi:MAG: hypothetical protein AAGL68_10995 [Pseudomonadota bacterium]
MMRVTIASLAIAGTLIAAPAVARDREIVVRGYKAPISPNNDSNKWWLDYKTDISEAERELDSDLRRATDEEDRRDAYEEYDQEIRDARYDYRKEMAERGYRVANFRENNRRLARR